MIKHTPTLSSNSKPGEWIKFQGTITYPETKTEFLRMPCSCWHTKVNAVFTTKEKKPGKGEITHRPKLYESSSNNEPLVISDGQTTLQCVFDCLWKTMLNPTRKPKYTKFPPNEEIKGLIKPKYRAFEISESFFSPRAEVILLAKLLTFSGYHGNGGKQESLGVVSGSANEERPTLLFEGSERGLNRVYWEKIFIAIGFILYIVVTDFFVWLAFSQPDYLGFGIAFGIACFAFLFVVRRFLKV